MAEPNLPPALHLKTLLASYPQLSEENPSSWFVWSENPNLPPKSWEAVICHADMRYTHAGYDYLVTAVPKNDAVSLRYLRMLIHGPFKAMSDLIFLIKVKDEHYLMCSELEKWPAPVLFNFCIASRVPVEFAHKLEGWTSLLEDGYPEVLAFCMSHSTGGKPFKHKRHFPEHGHDWFDPSSDWKKIIEGTPDLTGKDYKSTPGAVTPCNAIWGKSYEYEKIYQLNDLEIAEYFGFKHPPKAPKIKVRDPAELKWKAMNWDIEANPGLPAGAVQAAMNQLNQIQMQHAPNGAWAQVHQAIHDEGAIAPPVGAQPQPFPHQIDPIEDDFPEPDFDEFPDYEDNLDDD